MKSSGYLTSHRITAAAVSAVMFVFVLFSFFYIASETGHHCSGADCPVCADIQQCENVLQGAGRAVTAVSATVFIVLVKILICIPADAPVRSTPVSRKVRMNN